MSLEPTDMLATLCVGFASQQMKERLENLADCKLTRKRRGVHETRIQCRGFEDRAERRIHQLKLLVTPEKPSSGGEQSKISNTVMDMKFEPRFLQPLQLREVVQYSHRYGAHSGG